MLLIMIMIIRVAIWWRRKEDAHCGGNNEKNTNNRYKSTIAAVHNKLLAVLDGTVKDSHNGANGTERT